MEQTSRLSIVVDTRNAQAQLKQFSSDLRSASNSGDKFSRTMTKLGANGGEIRAASQNIVNLNQYVKQLRDSMWTSGVAVGKFSESLRQMRAATTGVAKNLAAINSAAEKTRGISGAIDKARISSGKLGTVIRDVNKNVTTLNTTLKAGTVAINRYSAASVTAGQRLNAFGRTATQTQTRLNGFNGSLSAIRSNMSTLSSTANGINSIFGNLDRTMARLSAATDRLNTATTRANAQINQLGGNMSRASGQARGLMGTLSSIQGLLSGGLFAITGISTLKTADQMQNLNSQIRIVTNSEEELLAVREKVRAIADKNFNDVAATTDLYQKSARALANLGKSQQEAVVFTDAVSLAMRTGGRSAGEQAAAILQLGQAMGAGALMGDEFRSISENAPILLELVSKRMGVLPGQLKELASEGKITSEIMYDAFSQNIGLLEEMATKIPLTMGQAFTRAKNQYKKYVDEIMNDTGGASSVIAGFITDIGNNFETLAKVGVAGLGLAFANVALSIGSASTAMAIFNAVAGLNPLILVAGGFLAVTSSIYGTNEVLTLTGTMIADLIGELGDMANFLGNTWDDVSTWIMDNVFQIEKAIQDSNDKNRKSYFGFYQETEKGFAGLVQRIMGNVASVGALTGTMITYYQQFVDNLIISVTNLMTAFENLYKMGKNLFGGNETLGDFRNYNALDVIQIYRNQNASNQDTVADYVRGANRRAGIADPIANSGLSRRSRFGMDGFFADRLRGGTGVYKRGTGVPDLLKRPSGQLSTDPMDAIKKAQYDQLKAQEAITAATEAREKLTKKQAKAAKSSELVRKAVLGGKDWGLSQGGGFGGARGHNGIDIPTPRGTQVYAPEGGTIKAYGSNASRGGKQMILVADSGKKYGFAHLDSFDVASGTRVPAGMGIAKTGATGTRPNGKGYGAHLHLTVTDINGKKVDPTKLSVGKTGYDNTIGKANASAAAKAERERIKVAEEAQREQQRIADLRLKLIKEYGDKELQLNIENDIRIAEIKDAGFISGKQDELIEQSKQQMARELAVYKKGLADKASELVSFQKTERDLLKKAYDDNVFELVSSPELSRPENQEQLKQAIINAKILYEYNVEQYEEQLTQQKDAMYAFQRTERQVMQDNWNAKLGDAMLMYDELRDYRIEAIKIEGAREFELFDTNQDLKLLELRKAHMTEMDYIKEKYALERQLVDLGNESDDVKLLQNEALRTPARDAAKSMLEGFEQQSPMGKIQAEYEANLLIAEEYEQKYTDMIGVQTEMRLAIEKNYQDAKRDLFLTQGEELFGALAGFSKALIGEQSSTYKVLYGIQKGFAISSAGIALWQSISEASKAPIPAKWGLMAAAAADGAKLVSTITSLSPQGFKNGGYTGNGGASQVAGVVHGQEYVFDAQSTKRIGVDNLNAMRRGDSAKGGGDVNINVNVDAKGNASVSGDNERMGRNMANGIKAVVMDVMRKEKRQGGMLYA